MNNRTRWKIAKRRAHEALLWYPDLKKEYEELVAEAMSRDPDHKGTSSKPLTPDPTAAAAIRLASNRKIDSLRRQVGAVEEAMEHMTPIELDFCRKRYWDLPKYTQRKATRFDYLEDSMHYERWTLISINKRVLRLVAACLGDF